MNREYRQTCKHNPDAFQISNPMSVIENYGVNARKEETNPKWKGIYVTTISSNPGHKNEDL